jgi:hypothetical protein
MALLEIAEPVAEIQPAIVRAFFVFHSSSGAGVSARLSKFPGRDAHAA